MLEARAERMPAAAALSCLIVIGFWLRIHHLGNLGFIVDEGHQALAVDGILRHGYPVLPSGRAYAWNLVFIYLQSAAALVFGVNEFSLRLPDRKSTRLNSSHIPLS